MSARTFLLQLAALSLFLAALVGVLPTLLPALSAADTRFALQTELVFALTCAGIFWVGKKTARSSNKNAFTNAVMISLFVKMIVTACMILVFNKLTHPSSTIFLLPFFIVYLGYTIFEAYFMIHLGKKNV